MATQRLLPNASSSIGTITLHGAASMHAATNDSSDSSYVAVMNGAVYLDFGTYTVPDNAQVRSIKPTVRYSVANFTGGQFGISWGPPETLFGPYLSASNAPLGTYDIPARALNAHNQAWSQDEINRLQLIAQIANGYIGEQGAIYEAYIDLTYNEAPVATAVGPNTTVTTSQPTWTWSYSDVDGDVCERVRIKLFRDDQYSAVGFDPNYATPFYDTGEMFTSATSWTCPVKLDNHHTYRAFVAVADYGSNGRYSRISSSGPYMYATVALSSLAAPLLDVDVSTMDGTPAALTVTGRDNLLSVQSADFESNIGDWKSSGTNCTAARVGGAGDAVSGSGVLAITVTANGDAVLTMNNSSSSPEVVPQTPVYGGFYLHSTGTPVQYAVLLIWMTNDGTIAETLEGPLQFTDTVLNVPNFARKIGTYDDGNRVMLGVKIYGASAGQVFHLDVPSLSPNPINQVRTSGFDVDSNSDGLADNWVIVNTGGDPAPAVSLDYEKVFGGIASQRIEFDDNNGLKGIQQFVPVSFFSTKLIQVWVAIEADLTDETVIQVRHGSLPWASVSGDAGGDSTVFYPITMHLDNTGSLAGQDLQIVTEQGGHVVMHVGCVTMIEGDPDFGDFGAAHWDGDETFGHYDVALMSGPISSGGSIPGHRYEVQRSSDAGLTWESIDLATNPDLWGFSDLSDVAPNLTTQVVEAWDFQAPRAPIMYRARSFATVGSDSLISNWSKWVSVNIPATGWWLKSTSDPSLNVEMTVYWDTFSEDEPIDVGVFEPIDSDETIVLQGRTRGKRPEMGVGFNGEETWATFNALRRLKETMLLQDTNGRQWYVRFVGDRKAPERKWNGSIERRLELKFIEVKP